MDKDFEVGDFVEVRAVVYAHDGDDLVVRLSGTAEPVRVPATSVNPAPTQGGEK